MVPKRRTGRRIRVILSLRPWLPLHHAREWQRGAGRPREAAPTGVCKVPRNVGGWAGSAPSRCNPGPSGALAGMPGQAEQALSPGGGGKGLLKRTCSPQGAVFLGTQTWPLELECAGGRRASADGTRLQPVCFREQSARGDVTLSLGGSTWEEGQTQAFQSKWLTLIPYSPLPVPPVHFLPPRSHQQPLWTTWAPTSELIKT